jgi:hypothetical protein
MQLVCTGFYIFMAVVLGFFVCAPYAHADDYTLTDLNFAAGPGQKLTLPVVTAKGINLTAAQLTRVLDPMTREEDRLPLVQSLNASDIDIPTITMTGDISFVVQSLHIHNLAQGRFDLIAMAGSDGTIVGAEKLIFKSGAFALEQGDMSAVLAALQNGHIETAMAHFSHLSLVNVRISHPTFEGPKGAASGDDVLTMAEMTGQIDYQGDVPLSSTMAINNVVLTPARNTKMAHSLADFGYDQLDLSLKVQASYHQQNQSYVIDDFTIRGAQAGALGFKSVIMRISPDLFQGSGAAMNALVQGQIDSLSLRYDDAGLFDKTLGSIAKAQKKTPAVVRREWMEVVNQMIPLLVMGDPVGIKLAQALSGFINKPSRFDLNLKARGGPIALSDLGSLSDPGSFLARVDVDAQALSVDAP